MHSIYLHGFASGPGSSKATFFQDKFESHGLRLEIPDLNVPSFEEMTLTHQLHLVEQLIAGRDEVLLIGSSMGGLIAAMTASKHPTVCALILLAPGFGLSRRWQSLWGEGAIAQWEQDGYLEVFHHARKEQSQLKYQFVQDAATHDSDNIDVSCPTLIIHGEHDTVVPVEESIKFQTRNSQHAALHVLNDDHQLLNTLPDLWKISKAFIDEVTTRSRTGRRL